jgi:hypothetical protein
MFIRSDKYNSKTIILSSYTIINTKQVGKFRGTVNYFIGTKGFLAGLFFLSDSLLYRKF